ncbi:putative glycosyltransferase EpsD [compost metagenome]
MIENNENGFIYEYNDVEDLAKKMQLLYDDKELARKLGQKAQINALKLYDKDKYIDKIEDIYKKVLEGK